MATFTYTAKVGGRQIGVKAKKTLAEGIARQLRQPVLMYHYVKELSGVIGEKEYTSVLWSPFETFEIPERERYQEELNAYIASLPDVVTPEIPGEFLARAKEIFDSYIPVKDKRETPAVREEHNAKVKEYEEQRDAEAKAWRAGHCQGEKQEAIPEGMMAVYLEITFDDSDSMTDYFESHRGIGDDMLLGIAPKGPETQRTARAILSRYPELNKLAWEWNTENYSMGHGNYLISDWVGEVEQHAYDGRTTVMYRYEIRMNGYRREMYAYKDYPGIGAALVSSPQPGGNGKVTIRRNEAKNGIEIVFPSKPGSDVLGTLKGLGFRWSPGQGLWYNRYSPALFAQVSEML